MKPTGLGLPHIFVLTLPALFGGIVIWWLIQSGDHARYAGAVGAVVGLTYALVGPTLVAELIASARAVNEALRARATSLGIALQNRLDTGGHRSAVTVTGAIGVCPLGFKTGDRWQVSRTGHLDRPLCRPAIAGITNRHLTPGPNGGSAAHCVCPLGGQTLTLEVEAA